MNPTRLVDFKTALKQHGVLASLAVLNDGVPHRYTALYHLREGFMVCLFMFDKQQVLHTDDLKPVPLSLSFCQFTLRDGVFRTENSAADPRLDGHPYQGVVTAYHAVPLEDRDGLIGTLCHFDRLERVLPDGEDELLRHAAQILPPYVWLQDKGADAHGMSQMGRATSFT